ncbi:MAG: hypothetical protein IBX68_00705 [Dehalococcoidia bacterium]|nr:hypothetical protein [Dehalococcoidia bacterium]
MKRVTPLFLTVLLVAALSIGAAAAFADEPEIVDIIFDQTGVGTDFTGTVLTVDGIDYAVGNLSVTVTAPVGEAVTFAFHSPLAGNESLYVWVATAGLSTAQGQTITVETGGGNITANYQAVEEAMGGNSIGFWSNKNGQALWEELLDAGNTTIPVNKDLARNARARDMSVMLEAQLSATLLNIAAGFVCPDQLVWVDLATGETMSIVGIVDGAQDALGLDENDPDTRAEQEYWKDLLDQVNNNELWFVVS